MNVLRKVLNSNLPRGLKLIIFALMVIFLACLPLLIYIIVGPSDGNPIGLGLIAFFGQLIGAVGIILGTAILLWDVIRK